MTPEELGALFAGMGSEEQARFFNGIAASTKTWPHGKGYSYGELQWCYLRDDMMKPENAEGRAVWQSISAFALLHSWEAAA